MGNFHAGDGHPRHWLQPRPEGLWCEPGGFFIDPARAVDRAVITHGHSDHARPGNRAVLATQGTLAIMRARLGDEAGQTLEPLDYGETRRVGEVEVSLLPAGHVLGSAQVRLACRGAVAIVSGDYKRHFDATCTPFEPAPCDVFVTEATFGLPVFRHPPDAEEIGRLLHSLGLFPERSHVLGVYALGKCQRIITLLRRAGYDRPIYLHGALEAMCEVYRAQGVALGELRSATVARPSELKGQIVLAPPSALADRWARRLSDPVTAMASGWMRVRQRAKQRQVELPLVISDHADWDELLRTIREVDAAEVWVTHGREEALVHAVSTEGRRARTLSLVGFEEEGQ